MLTLNLYRFYVDVVHKKYGDKYDYMFYFGKFNQKGLVKKENNVYNLTNECYKYRDIISWGFFSEEVQKRDFEFYRNM